MNATNTPTYADLVQWQLNLVDQVSSYSLEYTVLGVAIILAFAGAFYLFTLKPFEKEQQRQAEEIKETRKSVDIAFDLKEQQLDEKLNQAVQKVNEGTKQSLDIVEQKIYERVAAENSVTLAQSKEEIAKAETENASAVSQVRSDLIEEIRKLDAQVAKLNAANDAQEKELTFIKDAQTKRERDGKTLDIRISELETDKYLKENKMGKFLVPLRTLEKLLGGSDNLWRIPRWLENLKEGMTGVRMTEENKARISKMLDLLPEEYKVTKEEILAILKSDSSSSDDEA